MWIGCAMAQAVSHWSLIMLGFPVSNLVFPCQDHSKAPYYYLIHTMTLSNPSNWQSCSIKHLSICPITTEAWVQYQDNLCSILVDKWQWGRFYSGYFRFLSSKLFYQYYIFIFHSSAVMLYNLSKWQHQFKILLSILHECNTILSLYAVAVNAL